MSCLFSCKIIRIQNTHTSAILERRKMVADDKRHLMQNLFGDQSEEEEEEEEVESEHESNRQPDYASVRPISPSFLVE